MLYSRSEDNDPGRSAALRGTTVHVSVAAAPTRQSCRHRNTKCHHCGRKGHLAKVCSRGCSRERGAFAVEEVEGESEEEMLLALVAHSSADTTTLKPLEEELTWQGRKLRMILDTGSPVSVVPKNIFKKHRRWWPALKKKNIAPLNVLPWSIASCRPDNHDGSVWIDCCDKHANRGSM